MEVFLLTSAQTETFSQFVSSVKFVFVAKITSQSFDFANKCNHGRRAYGVFLERRPEGGNKTAQRAKPDRLRLVLECNLTIALSCEVCTVCFWDGSQKVKITVQAAEAKQSAVGF